MLESRGEIDEQYWGDRLEVSTDVVRERLDEESMCEAWVRQLSPRCRAILLEHLGIAPDLPVGEARDALLEQRDHLLPFLLADAFIAGKRTQALVDVAHVHLSPAQLASCQVGEAQAWDRTALLWRLYLTNPESLEIVFHLDRTHRKGFARLVLRDGRSFVAEEQKLDRAHVQTILDNHDATLGGRRQSHCAAVLDDGASTRVFIKRDLKPSFVAHGRRNTFGYEREWIVLDFARGLKRVQICSVSRDVPVRLANQLASACFGHDVRYENESHETGRKNLSAFLRALAEGDSEARLVELSLRNAGLDGSPQLRFNDPYNESIVPALQQYAAAFGDPLETPEDLESLKIHTLGKRVKMVFEPVDPDGGSFVVRYGDQPLATQERRQFEDWMRRDHGIAVLSLERKADA